MKFNRYASCAPYFPCTAKHSSTLVAWAATQPRKFRLRNGVRARRTPTTDGEDTMHEIFEALCYGGIRPPAIRAFNKDEDSQTHVSVNFGTPRVICG
eukprot:6179187-Pleurochrysis_carterae.AAC.1